MWNPSIDLLNVIFHVNFGFLKTLFTLFTIWINFHSSCNLGFRGAIDLALELKYALYKVYILE